MSHDCLFHLEICRSRGFRARNDNCSFLGCASAGYTLVHHGAGEDHQSRPVRVSRARARVSPVGTIRSDDGRLWVVPADTHFQTATKAADLYNQCSGVRLRQLSDLDLKKVPVIDAGGEEPSRHIFSPITISSSTSTASCSALTRFPSRRSTPGVVRFKANRPFTIAVMGVDWEENLGLGSERNRRVAYHPGDAGFVAVIKDERGVRLPLRINPGAPRHFTPRRSTIDRV